MQFAFQVAPELFYQLHAIHAVVSGSVVPLVYALLPSKTADTYKRCFGVLLEQIKAVVDEDFEGLRMMQFDFELAAINAFKEVFVGSSIKGNSMSIILTNDYCYALMYNSGMEIFLRIMPACIINIRYV